MWTLTRWTPKRLLAQYQRYNQCYWYGKIRALQHQDQEVPALPRIRSSRLALDHSYLTSMIT